MTTAKKMYRVQSKLTVTVSTIVEASSQAEAEQIARKRDVVTLCSQDFGDAHKEWVLRYGELDDYPTSIHSAELLPDLQKRVRS